MNPYRNARGRFTTRDNRPPHATHEPRADHPNAFAEAFQAFVTLQRTQPELLDAISRVLGVDNPPENSTRSPTEPEPAPEPRPVKVQWRKIAKGDARIWTATVSGHDLRVERKKTARGIVFDSYRDGDFQHRNKSSVTARERLAHDLARSEAVKEAPSAYH